MNNPLNTNTIYNINKFDGTYLVSIPELQINTTSTSITLLGRKVINYGDAWNENFVHLMENFARSTPPSPALIGQLWFNTLANQLFVYSKTGWVSIGISVYIGSTGPSNNNPGTFWFNPDGNILRIWNGSSWIIIGGNIAVSYTSTSTPSMPQTGQFWFNNITNELYIWSGTTWVLVGPEQNGAIISDTPPVNPLIGSLWYQSKNKILLIWSGTDWFNASAVTINTNAPDNPVIGQLWYNDVGRQLLLWTGSTWTIIGPIASGALVSAEIPTNRNTGLMWFNPQSGNLSIWNGVTFVNVTNTSGSSNSNNQTGSFSGALLSNTLDVSIPTGIPTLINWDTQSYDTDNYWSYGSNIQIPAGTTRVRVSARVTFSSDTGVNGYRKIAIIKNGSEIYPGSGQDTIYSVDSFIPVSMYTSTAVLEVSPGDRFSLIVQHSSSVSVNVLASGRTWINIERVI